MKQRQMKCSARVLKVALGITGMCLVAFVVGPFLPWRISEAVASSSSSVRHPSCSPCGCDCSSQPLFSLPEGMNYSFLTDCMEQVADGSEESGKRFSNMLSEELKLREADALESQRIADMSLLEAKKLASQYQKEAEKCNSGMETCEAAREKAEAMLALQREVTAMWKLRARQRGWTDRRNIRTHRRSGYRLRTRIDDI